jgi:hypothetical protein
MQSTIILSCIVVALTGPGVLAQGILVDQQPARRIQVDEPSEPVVGDGFTTASDHVNDEAMIESIVSAPAPQASVDPGAAIEEAEPLVPISAVLFSSSPGPKDCRGTPILKVGLPKPGSQHSTPRCYNVPGNKVAECGNFVANKDDGCEAKLFAEPNCLTFSNVAVFVPELKAVGGWVRSIEIQCGIIGVTPPPLNLPGMDLPSNAQQAVG